MNTGNNCALSKAKYEMKRHLFLFHVTKALLTKSNFSTGNTLIYMVKCERMPRKVDSDSV